MSTSKPNISGFGKTFEYLKDPDRRAKETGNAPLIVQDAEISGVSLQYLDWRNITFKNCDFVGAYQIKLQSMVDVRFEGCRFAGIFGFGKCDRVRFVQCGWAGNSVSYAGEKSTSVVFEKCTFMGTDSDANHWGGVGSDGEAEFVECVGQWFNVQGHAKLTMRDCEFRDVRSASAERESGGVFAETLIERCKLRGRFDMETADLVSLTIRDTQIEVLDLTGATVKGEVVMEKIKASSLKMGIQEGAQSLRLKDSWITGDGERVCAIYAGAFKHVLVEDVRFGGSVNEVAGIGGGYRPDDASLQPVLTQSITFRRVKAPMLRSARLNAAAFTVEDCEIERANFSQGHIDTLTFTRNTFSFTLDLSRTQVKEFKQSGGTDLRKLGGFKAEGSNIKLPR